MSNALSALQPILFGAAQKVSRELVGALPSIYVDKSFAAVAKGDTLKIPVAPARANSDFTPGATTSQGDDSTAAAVPLVITKSRKNSNYLTGEQIQSLQNGGNSLEWARQMMAQMMRALANEAESDLCVVLKANASRVVGTAGTTPFASDLKAAAAVLKALKDNGAPEDDLSLVIDTTAGQNLRGVPNLIQAYLAGTDRTLRDGTILPFFGMDVKESAGVKLHTAGNGASYVTSGDSPPGTTAISLVTGTGNVNPGDVVTFAADANNKYVAGPQAQGVWPYVGLTGPGTLQIGRPGTIVDVPTANAMTIGGNYTPNVAFHRMSTIGAVRPPMFTPNSNIRPILVTDEISKLPFLFLEIQQYGQISWEMHLAWGFSVVQPAHIVGLMG